MAGGAPKHVDWGARESYIAHIVMGKVVLARGEVGAASEHLRLAPRAAPPSSPSLSTLGLDTELAAALLAQGEKEAVVEYLTTMKDIWRRGARQLDRWMPRSRVVAHHTRPLESDRCAHLATVKTFTMPAPVIGVRPAS
jgi:hypothetical protein